MAKKTTTKKEVEGVQLRIPLRAILKRSMSLADLMQYTMQYHMRKNLRQQMKDAMPTPVALEGGGPFAGAINLAVRNTMVNQIMGSIQKSMKNK